MRFDTVQENVRLVLTGRLCGLVVSIIIQQWDLFIAGFSFGCVDLRADCHFLLDEKRLHCNGNHVDDDNDYNRNDDNDKR